MTYHGNHHNPKARHLYRWCCLLHEYTNIVCAWAGTGMACPRLTVVVEDQRSELVYFTSISTEQKIRVHDNNIPFPVLCLCYDIL